MVPDITSFFLLISPHIVRRKLNAEGRIYASNQSSDISFRNIFRMTNHLELSITVNGAANMTRKPADTVLD
jgi:hypothetical protein